MKHFFFYILSALFLFSCSEEKNDYENSSQQEKGTYITFKKLVETRSELNSAYVNYRKIEHVYLYVFDGNEATSKCIFKEEVSWTGDISKAHLLGKVLDAGAYTFLAIGTDDKAGRVYNFPDAISIGTEFGQCKARLMMEQRIDMPYADLYVGYKEATIQKDTINVVNTELKRKMAGVIAYLTNIPYQINGTRISNLKVKLYTNQHTEIPLITDDAAPFGQGSLENSNYLIDYDLSSYSSDASGTNYSIPAINTSNLKTVENSIITGAFMIPLSYDETDYNPTMLIELWGPRPDDSSYQLCKRYIVYDKTGPYYDAFPIEENHLYSIGQKLVDNATEGDVPVDLSGSSVYISIKNWTNYSDNVDFPSVSAPAYIGADFNPDKYIRDSPSNTEYIDIDASYPQTTWTLDTNCDWVYVVNRDESGNIINYSRTLTGNTAQKVELYITDYTVQRDGYTTEQVKNDIRTTNISLTTNGLSEQSTLPIKQYNTITLYSVASPGHYIGLRRLDYGCSFDKQTGAVIRPSNASSSWGYFSTGNLYVSGDNPMDYVDGESTMKKVYQRYLDNKTGSGAYVGSIFSNVRKEIINIDANGMPVSTGHVWYVPAYHENWTVVKQNDYELSVYNLIKNASYWSATGDDLIIGKAYIMTSGASTGRISADKNIAYFVRPICQFNN